MTEKIPNFEDIKVVDENGRFTPAWKNIMSALIDFLQKNYSQEGLVSPQQTTANVTTLSTLQSVGAILYDSDLDLLKVCIKTSPTTAIFKTINVT